MSKPRVLLADDHRIVAEGLKGLLADEFDLVHSRAVLQHLAQREAVLDSMIAAQVARMTPMK